MTYRIVVQGSDLAFDVAAGESILEAGLRQGVNLPYGCRNGACGACKTQIARGSVDHDGADPATLTEDDRSKGMTLLCCARAHSDIELICREVAASAIPARTFPARIEAMDRLAPDVMRIALRIPATERLQFLAGQYIEVLLKDGQRRAFSMANPPHDDELIELHVRHVPGGQFTDQVFSTMKPRDILRVHGPLGSFTLDEKSARPIVCVAGGTGFAPIKSIIEHALHVGCLRPIRLYWGAQERSGLYAIALAERWSREHAQLRFVPVLSAPAPGDDWPGRVGVVHEAVVADLRPNDQLADSDVYVCGSPAMVAAAREDFIQRCGLAAERFFADAFTFAHGN
jgi:CDP-4-dehydro-6-deoxyglucose reductase